MTTAKFKIDRDTGAESGFASFWIDSNSEQALELLMIEINRDYGDETVGFTDESDHFDGGISTNWVIESNAKNVAEFKECYKQAKKVVAKKLKGL